ncbi:hypothetical protein IAT40_000908 [Kwoniella sp. CBS 6097]
MSASTAPTDGLITETEPANAVTSQDDTTHAFHQRGDISFRSEDSVILWADSWKLAKSSKDFRDKLGLLKVVNQNGKRSRNDHKQNRLQTRKR